MAEEFDEGGVCGGKWWNSSSTNLFRSSPCSLATNSIGWPSTNDAMMDVRSRRSSDDDSTCGGGSASASDGSSSNGKGNNDNNMAYDSSTLQTMDHWNNQDLQIHDSGRSEDQNYNSNILQEATALDDSSMNYWQDQNGVVEFPQINTNINNFTQDHSCSTNSFKQVNQSFPLSQPLNSISSTSSQCQGLLMNSVSSYSSYTSSLLQTLFEDQPQQSLLLDNNQKFDYSTEFLPTTSPPMVNPYFAEQQTTNNQLPLITNNEPLWKNGVRSSFLPSTQSQSLLPSSLHINKPNNLPCFSSKHQNEQGKELGSVAKKASNNEPALKRQRIETPSQLPTFKVRKEKLGDRITALQQLVSPFGKTDTASVLHEAIEYIKFLHDQVTALSSPYLKHGSSPLQRLQGADNGNDEEEGKIELDLKRRGLCLVPISTTFPVAAETTADFWTPTFGPNFK